MLHKFLDNTDIKVSRVCLGTMTFGQQNTESEGHEQIDYAIDQGVNFIDTAEMYAVPSSKEVQGKTEEIIGTWLKKTGKRKDIVLASKVTGPNSGLKGFVRPETGLGFSRKQIRAAIEGNLSRLQTDYLDLYQLHWPERKTNFFGKLEYVHDENEEWEDNFLDIIQLMDELKKEGKIRHFGISNETPWGMMNFLAKARANGLEGPISIQNPYSLLNRSFEIGAAEISIREKMGLLVYSPLGFGVLSGKYLNNQSPENARITKFPQFSRYSNELALSATQKYANLAKEFDLSLTQLSIAFSIFQPFVTSSIIGATSMEQLKENIDSINLDFTDELRTRINEIHKENPNPAP